MTKSLRKQTNRSFTHKTTSRRKKKQKKEKCKKQLHKIGKPLMRNHKIGVTKMTKLRREKCEKINNWQTFEMRTSHWRLDMPRSKNKSLPTRAINCRGLSIMQISN